VKIYVYPAGLDGCGFYRLIWPAMALAAQGHDVKVVMPADRADEQYQLTARLVGDEIVDVIFPEDADVIVMQRVTHKNLSRALAHIRRKGTAVVVDMDDDLSKIDPRNPAYHWLHPKTGMDHNWDNAALACRDATWVTTSTPALQKVYGRPAGYEANSSVLYNMVEGRALDLVGAEDTGRFGWTGNPRSHPGDPQVMGSTVQRLVGEGHGFHMVGPTIGVAKEFRIPEESITTSGVLDTTVWLEALSALHVGLAPLADTSFNKSKSWLKPLELSARGVPCVMSPRAEYLRINALGAGVLAPNPKSFYREVKRLLTDDAWHTEVVERSREAVRALTIEANAWRWAEVWERAYKLERSSRDVLAR
jgi:hypothetical protein